MAEAVEPAARELFEACRNGDVERVKRLVTPEKVNSRDTAGRKSTPLHFAAGNRGRHRHRLASPQTPPEHPGFANRKLAAFFCPHLSPRTLVLAISPSPGKA
jgi:hypothetical protein